MKKIVKSLLSGALLVSVVYLALGLALLIMPELTTETMVKVGALAIILMGLVNLIKYLVRGVKGGHLNNFMTAGLTELAIGITLMIKPELVTGFVPTLMGIAILVDGFSKLQRSMDMLRIRFGGWLLILAFAVFVMVSAAVIFADPFKAPKGLTITIGIAFIFAGISGIAVWIVVSRQMKKYREKLEKEAQLKELAEAAGVSVEELKAAETRAAETTAAETTAAETTAAETTAMAREMGMPEISDPPEMAAESCPEGAVPTEATTPAPAEAMTPAPMAEAYVPSYLAEKDERVK